MSDELSFTELDGQHVELLPARTALSAFGILDGSIDDIAIFVVEDDGIGLNG